MTNAEQDESMQTGVSVLVFPKELDGTIGRSHEEKCS